MRSSRLVAALLTMGLLIAPVVNAMPVPSKEQPSSCPRRHGSGGEVILPYNAGLAVLVFLAVALSGADREEAPEYATAGLVLWLIAMSIHEYMYAPQII